MSYTRRNWLYGLVGAISMTALCRRPAKGQDAAAGRSCSGTVSDPKGSAIPKVVVEIIESDGRVSTADTDKQGVFAFTAPTSGPFMIQFREPQGNTRLHSVRQLTAETNQMVSVTIDVANRNFSASYDALQAVEALAAWMATDRKNTVAKRVFERIPAKTLATAVDQILEEIPHIEPNQREREFLTTKAQGIKKLLTALEG